LKKLIVESKWKRYLAARSRSQAKANARFAGHRRTRGTRALYRARTRRFKKDAEVSAPQTFSIIHNPGDTIAFLKEIQASAEKRNVFVDLSGVTTITPDAIAGLLAAIHRGRIGGARVSGNAPKDPTANQILDGSGFRTYVRSSPAFEYPVQKGKILKRQMSGETFQNRFDQNLAKELVAVATSKLTGAARSTGPSFSVLCEAMLNTWNHAAKSGEPPEPWWASVYVDSERDRACFTFIDQGVGIFESHRLTAKLTFLRSLRLLDRGQLLELIFKGQIPSTTRLPGRGNGIPGMYEHCKAQRIREFTIISNNVIGKGDTDTYEVLPTGFAGTLIYWEI
jgi:hypothetical protein